MRSFTALYLSSQHLTSVSYCLDTSSSLPWLGLPVKTWAPGWWRLVVVGLGDSSGGCSFTTHCAAGLSLDARVVPLAAGEMSCLLPFPYTPKPNEQHGTHPPVLFRLHYNLSLPPSYCVLHDSIIPLRCGSSHPGHPFFSLLLPPFIHPSLKPSICPTLLS